MTKKMVKMSYVVAAASLVAFAVGASDARADEEIVARVPFAFTVGAAHFAAGSYIVRSTTDDPAVMEIVSADGSTATFALTVPGSKDADASDRPGLVFAKVGDGYVLSRLVSTDGDVSEIPMQPQRGGPGAIDAGGAR